MIDFVLNHKSVLDRQATVARIQEKLTTGCKAADLLPDVLGGIILYGAGELGVLALEYCAACNIDVIGVIDKSKTGDLTIGNTVIKLLPFDKSTAEKFKQFPIFVAIANTPVKPIIDSLKSQGWKCVRPFYSLTSTARPGHPLLNGWLIQTISADEVDDVKNICEAWSDEASLEHYESFIDWHLNFTETLPQLDPIMPATRYLIEPVRCAISNTRGQLVDVGSHFGQMPLRFKDYGIDFKEYVLIEPDSGNRERLELEVFSLRSSSATVTILPDLLAAKSGSTNFAEGLGYCSQVWSKSAVSRPTVTLDDLHLRPYVLKIHTEGTEFDILQGGSRTILNFRPIIMFTTYHNRDGLSKSVVGPMRLFPDYSWYFRLHSFQGTGAVVYGVPYERST
jgi:FkbM family methyltransferase